MPDRKIFYVGTSEEVAHHAQPLVGALPLHIVTAEELQRHAVAGDVCIFFNEHFPHYRDACLEMQQRGCPTIYALDGIVEWRLIWEGGKNPRILRPVLSHKFAAIGRSQARVVESWGNWPKCEVVGIPRLDGALNRKPRKRAERAPFRVLIITAKQPAFSAEQRQRTKQALLDLKKWFSQHAATESAPLEPVWRITRGLDEEIGVANDLKNTTGDDLATALEYSDAVITTPSTAMLEGMLQGIPVALLDYNNCPHYVPAAWAITAPSHISQVVRELMAAPMHKMLYQNTILHDALECHEPATPRMVQLVEVMMRAAHDCLARNEPLQFPARILPTFSQWQASSEAELEPARVLALAQQRQEQVAQMAGDLAVKQYVIENLEQDLANKQQVIDRYESNPLIKAALKVRRKLRSLK